MPLLRIDLPEGKSDAAKQVIGRAVQEALRSALGVPTEERLQIIAEHGPVGLGIDPGYLGVQRSPEAIIVQVTLNRGRDAALKERFFEAAVAALEDRAGVRPANVVISLIKVGREDGSFGNGEAQLASISSPVGDKP